MHSSPFSPDTSTAVVRYQVEDVDRAVAFYTRHLGFTLKQRSGTVFATVSRGDLHLLLSGPGSSGSRPMPDGRRQEPGGWNRIVLYVDSLDAAIAALRTAGSRFRNEIETGPGGQQIQAEDLDGNPIEPLPRDTRRFAAFIPGSAGVLDDGTRAAPLSEGHPADLAMALI
jgi:catechol 2,3-dioxygenase-like lactoylglutathione lyase family enzyme